MAGTLMEAALLSAFTVLLFASSAFSQACTQPNEIVMQNVVNSTGGAKCASDLLICEGGSYKRGKCVVGYFNQETGRCAKSYRDCPELDTNKFLQLTTADRAFQSGDATCTNYYSCPANVNKVVIYPDFERGECDQYWLCYQGQLKSGRCTPDFNFYNPQRQTCETYPSITNTCVWQLFASPFTS